MQHNQKNLRATFQRVHATHLPSLITLPPEKKLIMHLMSATACCFPSLTAIRSFRCSGHRAASPTLGPDPSHVGGGGGDGKHSNGGNGLPKSRSAKGPFTSDIHKISDILAPFPFMQLPLLTPPL